MLDAFTTSVFTVALAETGDKTQLLAILLATRFKRPVPIILGILVATLANHFLSALAGASIAGLIHGLWFQYAVALSFIVMGLWTLIPDKAGGLNTPNHSNAFLATVVCFFLAEIGDKTQVATIALAAHFQSVLAVMAGTTIGMMLANVPAVFLGDRLVRWMPLTLIRRGAASAFIVFGIYFLIKII